MQSHFIQNLWSFLTTEAVPLTTIAAILGVIFAVLNLRKIAQDSHDRTRPYIALEPRLGVQLNGAIDLVITNYGQSPANNIVLTPIDPLEPGEDEYILPFLEKFIGRQFHMAPDASFRIMWRNITKGRTCGAPEVTRVKVTYQGPKRTMFFFQKTYKEEITVDCGFVRATPAPSKGARTNYSGDDQIKALKNIDLAIRTLNQHTANHY